MKRIGMVALMGRENVVQAAESIRRRMEQENIDVFCDSALHETLPGTGLQVSHVNLLDGTIEGLCSEEDGVFSVQYHPESAPGPQDSAYLFERFVELM